MAVGHCFDAVASPDLLLMLFVLCRRPDSAALLCPTSHSAAGKGWGAQCRRGHPCCSVQCLAALGRGDVTPTHLSWYPSRGPGCCCWLQAAAVKAGTASTSHIRSVSHSCPSSPHLHSDTAATAPSSADACRHECCHMQSKPLACTATRGMPWSADFSCALNVCLGSEVVCLANFCLAQVGSTLFVHGGVLPSHVEYGLERINQETRAWLMGDDPSKATTSSSSASSSSSFWGGGSSSASSSSSSGSRKYPPPAFLRGADAVVWAR